MDKLVQKIMKKGEQVAPVKSIKVKFQKVDLRDKLGKQTSAIKKSMK